MIARLLIAAVIATTFGVVARAEKIDTSFNALMARGFEMVDSMLLPLDVAKAYSSSATTPSVLVHLRKGSAVGLCYFGLSAWINGDAAALDNEKSCDLRTAAGADDGQYEFVVPVATNIIANWRVSRQTGEVGYCYFARAQENTIGEMACPKAGTNAGPQKEPGPYGLVRPQFEGERSAMRVNLRTGTVSLCYLRNDVVDCTPAAR